MEPELQQQFQQGRAKIKKPRAERQGKGTGLAMGLAGLALVLSAASGTLSVMMFMERGNNSGISDNGSSGNYYDGNSANFTEGSIADVASRVAPAVVSILTTSNVRDIFGRSRESEGAGTGMVVTADGYVLTNKHVVDGASKVSVVMDDGSLYENVKVVGIDPMNDVAYLKIADVKDLPTVTLGDSKTVSVGQPVIAIGNALGQYANTITSGIVSGTGRSVTATDASGMNAETLLDMIQTDAAINSGNSGGPLVNAAGEVIGMNTAVSTTAQSIGFAVPISSTKGMLGRIVHGGAAERAYLGVSYLTITAEVAKEYGLSVQSGAYIYREGSKSAVVADGPADKAGIRDGDIILAVGSVRVGSKGSISSLVGEYAVDETVDLLVLRDGKESTISVRLGAYPED